MPELSTVLPPWVAEDRWFDAVTATPDTIRAALLSGEGARVFEKRATRIKSVSSYGRFMVASGCKRGWSIVIGTVDSPPDLCAVHKGSKLEGKRIRVSPLRSLFKDPGEYFTWEQTETLMNEFHGTPSCPPCVAWVDLELR